MKHLRLCIPAWTRRLKSDELEQLDQEQLRIAELPHRRKCHEVRGLFRLSSDINGKRKHRDQVKHLCLLISDWTKRLEPAHILIQYCSTVTGVYLKPI